MSVPFHLCGQVVDYIRTAYKTKMRVWADGGEQVVPVRWFRASKSAKFVGIPTLYGSWKGWSRGEDNTGQLGEQTSEFEYDKGVNQLGYTGLVRCGSDEALQFGGLVARDEPILTDINGDSLCCGTRPPLCPGQPWPGPRVRATLTSSPPGDCACLHGQVINLDYVADDPTLPDWHLWRSAIVATPP